MTVPLKIIEIWKKKKKLYKGNQAGVLLKDLWKAFDTTNHSLPCAKLEVYGFSANSLKLLLSYVSNRFQQTHMNGLSSDWAEISQGSILGLLLFNIFLNDIFLFIKNNLSLGEKCPNKKLRIWALFTQCLCCTYADALYNLDLLKLDLQFNFSILPKMDLWKSHDAQSW